MKQDSFVVKYLLTVSAAAVAETGESFLLRSGFKSNAMCCSYNLIHDNGLVGGGGGL